MDTSIHLGQQAPSLQKSRTPHSLVDKVKNGAKKLTALLGLTALSYGTQAQKVELYKTNDKMVVVPIKTKESDQWDLHRYGSTYIDLRRVSTSSGDYQNIDDAANNEITQQGPVRLEFIGSGNNELPVFTIDLSALTATLEDGYYYIARPGIYYNGEYVEGEHTIGRQSAQFSIFFSKSSDGVISVHTVGVYHGSENGWKWYPNQRANKPNFDFGSSTTDNTKYSGSKITVNTGKAESLKSGLKPVANEGKMTLSDVNGNVVTSLTKNLTRQGSSYTQSFDATPAYGVKIAKLADNNKPLSAAYAIYGSLHYPGYDLRLSNAPLWHDSPQFGAVQATPRDATHYDVTIPVNNIKAGATGVTVQAINQSTGQTITGSYDATTKQAKFTNLAVSSSDLITAFDLKLSYGVVAGSHSPTTQTSLDNRTAPEIKTNPLMINFVNGKTDTTFYLRNNLNNPKVFNDNTLYTAKSSLPSGVTIASDGKVTISKTTAPQTTTVNSEVSRTLRDGSKVKSAQDQQLTFTISQDQSANTEHEHNNDGVISISSVDGVVSIAAGSTISFSDLPSNFNEGSYSILSDDFSALQLSKGSYSASSGISTSGLQSAKSYIIYLVSADKKATRSIQVVVR